MKAIILAAGMATRLRPLTLKKPKCLLSVGERPLLQRTLDALIAAGIQDFTIVTGYLHEMIEAYVAEHYPSLRVNFIHNALYDKTNNIYSLWLARPEAEGHDILLLDSDLLFDPAIPRLVLQHPSSNVLTLIRHELGEEEMKVVVDGEGQIVAINKTCQPSEAIGESLGIEKMGASYTAALYQELNRMMNAEHLEDKYYEMAFERLIAQGHTYTIADATHYFSCELDTVEDFENAKQKIPASLY